MSENSSSAVHEGNGSLALTISIVCSRVEGMGWSVCDCTVCSICAMSEGVSDSYEECVCVPGTELVSWNAPCRILFVEAISIFESLSRIGTAGSPRSALWSWILYASM